uniref:protein-serine/threonine phosphatase n=1 Tax=Zea mays TaxID=4577 RepID=A0A804LHZ2_MAIZE
MVASTVSWGEDGSIGIEGGLGKGAGIWGEDDSSGGASQTQALMARSQLEASRLRRSRRLDAVQSGCSALSIVKQGDLMVVANVGDSRVVLGTAFEDDAITSSSSSST